MGYFNGIFGITDVTENTTPLWTAALHGHVEEVKELIFAKADYKAKCTERQCTALHIAALMGHKEIVSLLIKEAHLYESSASELPLRDDSDDDDNSHCRYVDQKDVEGCTALSYAAAGIQPEIVTILLKNVPKLDKYSSNVDLPYDDMVLSVAFDGCRYSVDTRNRLSCRQNMNSQNRQDHMLHTVKILLSKGYIPDKLSMWDFAIDQTDTNLLEVLLGDEEGRHGLNVAFDRCNCPNGNILREIVLKTDSESNPVLDVEMMKLIVATGVSPFQTDISDITPIEYAIERNKFEIVKYLISLYHKHRFKMNAALMERMITIPGASSEMQRTISEENQKYNAASKRKAGVLAETLIEEVNDYINAKRVKMDE